MNSKILIDTSVLIEYFRGNAKVASFIEEHLYENKILLHGIVLSELLQGIKTEKEFIDFNSNIDAIPYIDMTYEDFALAGKIGRNLRKTGITLPLTDLMIAATAINNKMDIATFDKHFKSIPGIKIYDII